MRHARVQFETTKNHLGKHITLKTGSRNSQTICGRMEDGGRRMGHSVKWTEDGGWGRWPGVRPLKTPAARCGGAGPECVPLRPPRRAAGAPARSAPP